MGRGDADYIESLKTPERRPTPNEERHSVGLFPSWGGGGGPLCLCPYRSDRERNGVALWDVDKPARFFNLVPERRVRLPELLRRRRRERIPRLRRRRSATARRGQPHPAKTVGKRGHGPTSRGEIITARTYETRTPC